MPFVTIYPHLLALPMLRVQGYARLSPVTTDDPSYKSTQASLILVSCPPHMCLLARNNLVKYEVKFLGLITQKW